MLAIPRTTEPFIPEVNNLYESNHLDEFHSPILHFQIESNRAWMSFDFIFSHLNIVTKHAKNDRRIILFQLSQIKVTGQSNAATQ